MLAQILATPVTMISEIDAEIRALLFPSNLYINNPYKIEAPLLHPFQTQTEQMLLLITQQGQVLRAFLEAIEDTYLIARTRQSVAGYKPEDRVLVIFPTRPNQHYVLQTWIDDIYPLKLKLRYQDPRYEARHHVQLISQPTLQLAPAMVVTALEQRQFRLLRRISLDPNSIKKEGEGYIADFFCKTVSPEPSPYMQFFQEAPPIFGSLQNISCGGVCLALTEEDKPEKLLYRLVLLHITLPQVPANTPVLGHPPMTLKLLGNIRGITPKQQRSWTVHIAFLKRLPHTMESFFAHLERCFLKKQSPLA